MPLDEKVVNIAEGACVEPPRQEVELASLDILRERRWGVPTRRGASGEARVAGGERSSSSMWRGASMWIRCDAGWAGALTSFIIALSLQCNVRRRYAPKSIERTCVTPRCPFWYCEPAYAARESLLEEKATRPSEVHAAASTTCISHTPRDSAVQFTASWRRRGTNFACASTRTSRCGAKPLAINGRRLSLSWPRQSLLILGLQLPLS